MISRPTTKELLAASLKELVARILAAIFLVEYWGYFGACLANPMAWLGAAIPLTIAFMITRKNLMRLYKEDD